MPAPGTLPDTLPDFPIFMSNGPVTWGDGALIISGAAYIDDFGYFGENDEHGALQIFIFPNASGAGDGTFTLNLWDGSTVDGNITLDENGVPTAGEATGGTPISGGSYGTLPTVTFTGDIVLEVDDAYVDFDGATLFIQMNAPISVATGFGVTPGSIGSPSGSGVTWSFPLSPVVLPGDVLTLSYSGTDIAGLTAFSGRAIRNQSRVGLSGFTTSLQDESILGMG